jgi:hypothetical protein
VEVKDGFYHLVPVFKNCTADPIVKLFPLKGKNASYSGMAKTYRDYQIARGACKPLKERIINNPVLEESTRSIMVRMRMGWKPVPPQVLEQTEENEPPLHTAITFSRAAEILHLCRAKGIKHAEFCLVGWNKGGHDGAFPDLFPVEEAFGGEKELRKLLKTAQELNYNVAAHTNLIDSYSFSERCTPDDRLVDADGSYHLEGQWAGGQSYYLCPRCAFERFAKEDFPALWDLGFRGTHYLDVSSIVQPNARESCMTVFAVQPSISLLPEHISITVVLGTPLICDRRYMDMFFSRSMDCIVMFIPSFLTTIISVNRPFVNMKPVPKKKYPDINTGAGDCGQ